MNTPAPDRLVISEQDLAVPLVPPAPPSLTALDGAKALRLPPVQGVAARQTRLTTSTGSIAMRAPQARNAQASAVGILLGFSVSESFGVPSWRAHSPLGLDVHAGVWVALLGLSFAVIFAAWDQIATGSWDGVGHWLLRAGPARLGLGFASGFIAQAIYLHLVEATLRHATLQELLHLQSDVDLYLARAFAWSLFGLGMGLAVAGGLSHRRKLVNGAVGGAVGGALGGVVFQRCSFQIHSGGLARLIGLLVVGLSVGAAIGIVERLRRDAWLRVVGGPLVGKEFIAYGPRLTIGSASQCDVMLPKDRTLSPFHAIVTTTTNAGGEMRTLESRDGAQVLVNNLQITRHALVPSDRITLGSYELEYSEPVS